MKDEYELKAELVGLGIPVATDEELDSFMRKMRTHQDAMLDEPATLPKVDIDFAPEAIWDDEADPLHLLTPDEFEKIPDGATLVTINGKIRVKGYDEIHDDTRCGVLAVGVRESQLKMPKEHDESLQHAMQERTLRYWWEKKKLDLSEWWLRVVMRKGGVLDGDDE